MLSNNTKEGLRENKEINQWKLNMKKNNMKKEEGKMKKKE